MPRPMPRYEYKVIPAPSKGQKAKGVKTAESRFALAIETTLNEMGAEGWEFLRAELLPSDERSGLTGSTVNWRNVLVFRRAVESGAESFKPRLLEAPDPAAASTAAPETTAPTKTGAVPAEPAAPARKSAPVQDPPLHSASGDDGSKADAQKG